MPRSQAAPEKSDLRADLAVLRRTPVLLGLATTVLGYAGVFAVFTYIAPLLTEISGFKEAAVSPILLVFGGGLIAGNLARRQGCRPLAGAGGARQPRGAGRWCWQP